MSILVGQDVVTELGKQPDVFIEQTSPVKKALILTAYAGCVLAFLIHSFRTYTINNLETSLQFEELSSMPLPVQFSFIISKGVNLKELSRAGYKNDLDYFLGYSKFGLDDIGWGGHFREQVKDNIQGKLLYFCMF
jgi:hypothetical protein